MCEAHNHSANDYSANDHGENDAPNCHHSPGTVRVQADDTAECPVMRGSFVSKSDAEAQGLIREYKESKYYLCCAACGPLFDADPEKYVAVL